MANPQNKSEQNDELFQRRRRRRSIAIGIALAVLVAIFYAITVVRVGPDVLMRDL